MGADYIDYIVADHIVIPTENEEVFFRKNCLHAR
jgi:predicted O-linked N-acetylglucosamine transferase (SPINDLY family)